MFKFPFISMNKLSMFIIDLSTPLFAIPSFVPLLGLFLLTVFCLVMGHIFSTWLVCSFFIGCWYWISHFRELDFVLIPSDIVRVCSQLGTSNKSHPFKVCLLRFGRWVQNRLFSRANLALLHDSPIRSFYFD